MDTRKNDILQLKSFNTSIDKELTMILQSLQWDRNELLKGAVMISCKYDPNHRIPESKREEHEKNCSLKQQGYCNDERLLPEPLDVNAYTLVKLNVDDISTIIENAAKSDPLFKKGVGRRGPAPSALSGLQTMYTADERRAIHDAVVCAVPSCHDLTLLCSNKDEQKTTKSKSRVEILAELRDMRRRRAKYRVAAKTRNYSDVLRDVIKTQMEFYTDVQNVAMAKDNNETVNNESNSKNTFKSDNKHDRHLSGSSIGFNDRRERFKGDFENKRETGGENVYTNRHNERYRDRRNDFREDSDSRDERERHVKRDYKYKKSTWTNKQEERYKGISQRKRERSVSPKESGKRKNDARERTHSDGRYNDRRHTEIEDDFKYSKFRSRDSQRHYKEQSSSSHTDFESNRVKSRREETFERSEDFNEIDNGIRKRSKK